MGFAVLGQVGKETISFNNWIANKSGNERGLESKEIVLQLIILILNCTNLGSC